VSIFVSTSCPASSLASIETMPARAWLAAMRREGPSRLRLIGDFGGGSGFGATSRCVATRGVETRIRARAGTEAGTCPWRWVCPLATAARPGQNRRESSA
jgi:hypothetical protein